MKIQPEPMPTDPEQKLNITCAYCGKEISFSDGAVFVKESSYCCEYCTKPAIMDLLILV